MTDLDESVLERHVGDLTARRRLVSDILDHDNEFLATPAAPWYFGVLTVTYTPDGHLRVETPDGDIRIIRITTTTDSEAVERIEAELIQIWEWWLDAL